MKNKKDGPKGEDEVLDEALEEVLKKAKKNEIKFSQKDFYPGWGEAYSQEK